MWDVKELNMLKLLTAHIHYYGGIEILKHQVKFDKLETLRGIYHKCIYFINFVARCYNISYH